MKEERVGGRKGQSYKYVKEIAVIVKSSLRSCIFSTQGFAPFDPIH